jgi:molybdenum cofactor biosynthesis enzyme MoaA
MPFDGNVWSDQKMVSYAEMLSKIREKHPEFSKITHDSMHGQTSKVYQIPGFKGRVGFISSMSNHFCGTCNRVRLTADGNLKVCLFGQSEVNLKEILRNFAKESDPEDDLTELQRTQLTPIIQAAILNKKPQHAGMYNIWKDAHQNRPMIRIGG